MLCVLNLLVSYTSSIRSLLHIAMFHCLGDTTFALRQLGALPSNDMPRQAEKLNHTLERLARRLGQEEPHKGQTKQRHSREEPKRALRFQARRVRSCGWRCGLEDL